MPAKAGVHKPGELKAARHLVARPKSEPQADRQKKRALPTWSKQWRALRAVVLSLNPLCVECQRKGKFTPAIDVDHVDGNDSNNDPGNLQGLCKSCHTRKTNREQGGYGNVQMHPDWMPKPACRLVVVCGPPGAGKSTYVRVHAGPSDTVIDTDVMSREMYQRPLHQLTRTEFVHVFRERNHRVADLSTACAASTAWLIATEGAAKKRMYWERLGADVVIIHPGVDECIKQLMHDTRRDADLRAQQIKIIKKWR